MQSPRWIIRQDGSLGGTATAVPLQVAVSVVPVVVARMVSVPAT